MRQKDDMKKNRWVWFLGLTFSMVFWLPSAFGESRKSGPVIGEVVFGLDAIAAAERLTAGARRTIPLQPKLAMPMIPVPSPSAQPDPQAGGWEELNRAREQARRALEDSARDSEKSRPSPVTLPNRPDLMSPALQSDLAQMTRAYEGAGAEQERPRSVLADRVGISPYGDAPEKTNEDPLDSELRAFEKSMSGFEDSRDGNKLLAPMRSEGISSRYSPSDEPAQEDVPMLVPRRIAKVKKSQRAYRKIASAARKYSSSGVFSASAKGSTRERIVKLEENPGVVSEQLARFERRQADEIQPSKGRGKNVRYHDIGGEEE